MRKGKIYFFWKENKMKSGNKDALQSGKERYTTKNTLQPEFFLCYTFSLMLLMDFFKNMCNYHYQLWNTARIIIIKKCIYVTSFSPKFYGHMFISLKFINVLQKKEEIEEMRKKWTKRIKGYDIVFGGLCIFAYQ